MFFTGLLRSQHEISETIPAERLCLAELRTGCEKTRSYSC